MADKFFFQGRQNARQDHTNHDFKGNVSKKMGGKKSPLSLTVTSEARKTEVEALLSEHKLYATIDIDERDDGEENISSLTALINTPTTITTTKTPARNEPCSCGSGKKYKKCCAQG